MTRENVLLSGKRSSRPDMGSPISRYHGFDHIVFWVNNAKQAASFYCTRFGFKHVLYRGLETGERQEVHHVCQKNGIYFVFQSPLNPLDELNKRMSKDLKIHGDGVKDVAFRVSDCRAMYQKAIERGAVSIRAPWEVSDQNGTVIMATIATVSLPNPMTLIVKFTENC
jgi:4-hydroxyphenylpyruvate dioxygenase